MSVAVRSSLSQFDEVRSDTWRFPWKNAVKHHSTPLISLPIESLYSAFYVWVIRPYTYIQVCNFAPNPRFGILVKFPLTTYNSVIDCADLQYLGLQNSASIRCKDVTVSYGAKHISKLWTVYRRDCLVSLQSSEIHINSRPKAHDDLC